MIYFFYVVIERLYNAYQPLQQVDARSQAQDEGVHSW